MKSIIIYHSQTGNTYKIARAIQSGINHSLVQCRIVALKKVKPEDLTEYDEVRALATLREMLANR